MHLSLRNFVVANGALSGAFKTVYIFNPYSGMLGFAALHTLSPQTPRRWFHFPFHQCLYIIFTQPKLGKYGIKRRAVFPCHFNNTVNIVF